MVKKPMPHPGVTVRKLLLHDEEFVRLSHGGTVAMGPVPDPLTRPHTTVAVVGMGGNDPMLRRPIVQVTPWVPDTTVTGIDEDPAVTAWNMAVRAGALLGRKRNVIVDDLTAMSIDWIDGPHDLYDTERGYDRAIFYAPVRFMCHLRYQN